MDLGNAGAMDFGDDGIMDNNDPVQQTAKFFGPGGRLYRNYHPFLSSMCFLIQFLLNVI